MALDMEILEMKSRWAFMNAGLIFNGGNGGNCLRYPWSLPWCPFKSPNRNLQIPHRGALCHGKIALPLQVRSIRPVNGNKSLMLGLFRRIKATGDKGRHLQLSPLSPMAMTLILYPAVKTFIPFIKDISCD